MLALFSFGGFKFVRLHRASNTQEKCMENLAAILAILMVGCWCYPRARTETQRVGIALILFVGSLAFVAGTFIAK